MYKEAEQELIQSGVISAADMHSAKAESCRNHTSILLSLLKKCSTENSIEITKILAQHYNTPLLSLNKIAPPHGLMQKCNAEQARKHLFLPVTEHGSQLVIAMVDPLDLNCIDEIRAIFQQSIQPVFISMDDFEYNYYRFFREETSLPAENPELMNTDLLNRAFLDQGQPDFVTDKKVEMAKKFAATIIAKALAHKASGFTIDPQQDICMVNLLLDGSEYSLFRFSTSNHKVVVDAMMRLAKLDPFRRIGVDQFGRASISYRGKKFVLAFCFRQTPGGEQVVVHIIDPSLSQLTIEMLGLSKQAVGLLKGSLESAGMMLVTGPRGSGKSTMLQTIAHYATTLNKDVYTIEDIIGLKIEGARQFQAKPQGPSKAAIVKALQKKGAAIIMVDEVDSEALPAILDAVEGGCFILIAMTAPDISKALSKLIRTGISRSRLASALKLIQHHKLIRMLRPSCATLATIHPATMKQWQISENMRFKTGRSCNSCNNHDDHCVQKVYEGTMSLCEQLVISPEITALITQGASGLELFEAGRYEGMLTLIEQGIGKALDGKTSLEEVLATVPYHEPFPIKDRMRMGRIMPLKRADRDEASPTAAVEKTNAVLPVTVDDHAHSEERPNAVNDEKKQEGPPEQEHEEERKARVLLVDDSPVTLEFTRHILDLSGYFHVDVANTAMKALDMLQQQQYHLVITDQEMPEQTGQEFIDAIRQHPSLNGVGTILLTGNLNEMSALASGADGYIDKSTAPELLVARAKSISDIYKRLSSTTSAKPTVPRSIQPTGEMAEKVQPTKQDMAKTPSFELELSTSDTSASN